MIESRKVSIVCTFSYLKTETDAEMNVHFPRLRIMMKKDDLTIT